MLKVVAVTAPHWVEQKNSTASVSLNSREPFSLYNAIRHAAYLAQKNIGVWGESNWNTIEGCSESIMLYEYFENQKGDFLKILNSVKPNLLFIGSMSLGFAGAIEIAKIAKSIFGNLIFIVIGGKHIIETTYLTNGKISGNGNCCMNLMKAGKIPKVFDLILAGDGEEVIVEIGNIISCLNESPQENIYKKLHGLSKAKGDWLAGWLDENNSYQFIKSTLKELDQNSLPPPIKVFGVKSNFPIFQSDITAHTYSYMSKGCVFNCFFCSERQTINGKLQQKDTAPERLFEQFYELNQFGLKHKLKKISAFVEDSVLLGGNINLLYKLDYLLLNSKIKLQFGGQMTCDLLLNTDIQNSLRSLSKNGLSYLFIGLETNNIDIANQMSKNTSKKINWIDKYKIVLDFLRSINVKCGFSILFGLGEKHNERIKLLNLINEWQDFYGTPHVISLNYATQHPLKNYDLYKYDYSEWGTSKNSPLLPIFTQLFGEASEKYIIPETELASPEELMEISELFMQLNLKYQ